MGPLGRGVLGGRGQPAQARTRRRSKIPDSLGRGFPALLKRYPGNSSESSRVL